MVETDCQDVKDGCERYVMCRRAKIQPQMAATLYPLHFPPRPLHTVGLGYFANLRVSNGFDNMLIIVDHMTGMAHFLPCTKTQQQRKMSACLYRDFTYYTDCPECALAIATRNSLVAFGWRFGDTLERV
jgi:hypothetical protein